MLSIYVDKVMFLFQLCIACWCHDHPDLHSMETRIFGYCPQLRDAHHHMEIEDGVYRAVKCGFNLREGLFDALVAPDCSTAARMSGAAGRDAALRLENMSSVGSFTPYNGTHYNVILMLLSL